MDQIVMYIAKNKEILVDIILVTILVQKCVDQIGLQRIAVIFVRRKTLDIMIVTKQQVSRFVTKTGMDQTVIHIVMMLGEIIFAI